MSSKEPDTTKASHPKATRKGSQGLKGPQGLKGARDLKGIKGLRGANNLKGVHGLRSVHNIKSASQLRGAHNIPGINERNPNVEVGISLIQALLQYGLKTSIEKLQENVGNLSTKLKENLQSGLQNNLQVNTSQTAGSSREKEKAMADTNDKEHTEQGSEKNVEEITPQQIGEQIGANAERITKMELPDTTEGNKAEAGELSVESIQDLLQKFSRGFKTTKETLDIIASGVNTAQDVLNKAGPVIDQQPALSSIRDTLNKVSKSVNTAENILDKVAPFVDSEANLKFLPHILSPIVAVARALHEILDSIRATLGSLQELLSKIASGSQALGHLVSLAGKQDIILAVQNKFMAVIHTLQDLIKKIVEAISNAVAAIGRAQSALFGKVTSLVGPHPEEEAPAASGKGEALSVETLAALSQANVINMDAPLKSIFDQIEGLHPEPATGWGVIGDGGHMVLVWSGR